MLVIAVSLWTEPQAPAHGGQEKSLAPGYLVASSLPSLPLTTQKPLQATRHAIEASHQIIILVKPAALPFTLIPGMNLF